MPLVLTESTIAATENFVLNLSHSVDKNLLASKNTPSYITVTKNTFHRALKL